MSFFIFFICHTDLKSEVRNMTENRVGIENGEIAATEGGILIVGAEIVIGTMIVIAESVTEIQTGPAIMIQEVTVGHAHGQGNVPRIMIATGDCSSIVAISDSTYICLLTYMLPSVG